MNTLYNNDYFEKQYNESKIVNTFADLDLNFTAHPVTGDLVKKWNVEAIKSSMLHLVLLNFYEKPFHFDIGAGTYATLFENGSEVKAMNAFKRRILAVIKLYEPRVSEVSVSIDEASTSNTISVSIFYVAINSTEQSVLNVALELNR